MRWKRRQWLLAQHSHLTHNEGDDGLLDENITRDLLFHKVVLKRGIEILEALFRRLELLLKVWQLPVGGAKEECTVQRVVNL